MRKLHVTYLTLLGTALLFVVYQMLQQPPDSTRIYSSANHLLESAQRQWLGKLEGILVEEPQPSNFDGVDQCLRVDSLVQKRIQHLTQNGTPSDEASLLGIWLSDTLVQKRLDTLFDLSLGTFEAQELRYRLADWYCTNSLSERVGGTSCCMFCIFAVPVLAFDNPVVTQYDTAHARLGVSWFDHFQWCAEQRYTSPDARHGVLGLDIDTLTFDHPGNYPVELKSRYYLPQLDEYRDLHHTFHLTVAPAK